MQGFQKVQYSENGVVGQGLFAERRGFVNIVSEPRLPRQPFPGTAMHPRPMRQENKPPSSWQLISICKSIFGIFSNFNQQSDLIFALIDPNIKEY